MTFSARSFAVSASAVTAVPLIGPDETTPSATRRNSSGDAETTQTGWSDAPTGTCTPPANGAGLPASSTAASARASGSSGRGADRTRQRFAW